MNVKPVNQLVVNNEQITYTAVIGLLKEKYNNGLQKLLTEITDLLDQNSRWIYIKNKNVYYNKEIKSLIPNLSQFELSSCGTCYEFDDINIKLNFESFEGQLPTIDELYKMIDGKSQIQSKSVDVITIIDKQSGERFWYDSRNGDLEPFNSSKKYISYHVPIYHLIDTEEQNEQMSNFKTLVMWLDNDLIPEGLTDESYEFYESLYNLYKNYCLKLENLENDLDESSISIEFEQAIKMGIIDYKNMEEQLKLQGECNIGSIVETEIYKNLLNCEKIRADIDPYDEKILTDPNRGHWDLWQVEEQNKDGITIRFTPELMAKNPVVDIKEDGVVGIDFGTKSTVVVYQENSDYILPMRVGSGQFNKEIEAKQYENPTVMEFINLEKFLNDYRAKEGRPSTYWEDLTVSYTASNSLVNSSSEYYYSYLSELKQWAGDKRRNIRLRDKQGNEFTLNSYMDLTDEEFDPIEIYAYYLGLYINNMHMGIYLDYILSFPATYEMSIRRKIIHSFEKGLKKSLPESLIKNEEIMQNFRVASGESEPTAYAICALEEYGFKPIGDEKIFYGIFDFGGGTTDFDFGIWREAQGIEQRRFDYVAEHFKPEGDRYLGGENLLELLSFEVFKQNQASLRETGITFILPAECKRFAGSETLLSDSQEAKINTKQLMEKLRPLWENREGYEDELSTGIIKVNLFDKTGKQITNFELSVDADNLKNILHDRIEKGIINFFASLSASFSLEQTRGIKDIKIFLAGNSSKSEIVKSLFSEYIEKETASINSATNSNEQYFEIYPPLGTEEAYLIQQQRGIEIDRNEITSPTGKTGVAFGLIKGRHGGRIKVIDRNIENDEIKFKYFVGYEQKGVFKVVLDRDTTYNKWELFTTADYEDLEFYYTDLPEANNNNMNIKNALKKRRRIAKTFDNANVYIRTVSPSALEFVVAEESEIENGKYLTDIVKLDLE